MSLHKRKGTSLGDVMHDPALCTCGSMQPLDYVAPCTLIIDAVRFVRLGEDVTQLPAFLNGLLASRLLHDASL